MARRIESIGNPYREDLTAPRPRAHITTNHFARSFTCKSSGAEAGSLTSKAAPKLMYLAHTDIIKKRNASIKDWAKTSNQLAILSQERFAV